MQTQRRLLLLLIALSAAVSACGGSGVKTTTAAPAVTTATPAAQGGLTQRTSPSAPQPSPSSAAPSPVSSGAAPAGSPCATSQLGVQHTEGQGAAGTEFSGITFRNRSSSTCTLQGYPGVSLLDGTRQQIGEPAKRVSATAPVVVLAPGQSATAKISVTPAACSNGIPQQSAYLRVFPPNQRADLVIPAQVYACEPAVYPVNPGSAISAD